MTLWAAKWKSKSLLDGVSTHLILWDNGMTRALLFPTRRACRIWIEEKYGYIKQRPDLRREPHGWRVPTAVRVEVRENV